jgi:hypothetical protein
VEGRIPTKAVPGWITLGSAVVLLCLGLVCSVDVLAPWASWGPHVTVTVTVPGTGGRHSDDGTGTYQDTDGVPHTVHLQGAAVNAGQRVPVTLSPIPWDRGTVYNGAAGPLATGEALAAPLLLLTGGAVIVHRIRRHRTSHAPT